MRRKFLIMMILASTLVIGTIASAVRSSSPADMVAQTILVERGVFFMGGHGFDERPLHRVVLTYDFHIGTHPVTFEEYDLFCQETGHRMPSDQGWGRERRPVTNVSWYDAIAYCNWLSEKEGLSPAYNEHGNFLDARGSITTDLTKVVGYRLPTEAEWEFAARGGIMSRDYEFSGSNCPDDVAWYFANAEGMTQAVGKKAPNELGIYDMSGNVWEWCSDCYESSFYRRSPGINPYNDAFCHFRVARGGSWYSRAYSVRNARRSYLYPTYYDSNLGFRIARTSQ